MSRILLKCVKNILQLRRTATGLPSNINLLNYQNNYQMFSYDNRHIIISIEINAKN